MTPDHISAGATKSEGNEMAAVRPIRKRLTNNTSTKTPGWNCDILFPS